jgi:hypothetical protein
MRHLLQQPKLPLLPEWQRGGPITSGQKPEAGRKAAQAAKVTFKTEPVS